MSYSMDKLSERCDQITEEAERCMVLRPLSQINEYSDEMWNRGLWNADDSGKKWKWYDYSFVHKGRFICGNSSDFPVTYGLLREMNKYFPIESAGYIWMMPQSHIPPHQVATKSGYLVAHMGLIVPPETLFLVSRSNYQYERGRFIIFDDNDIHESYNNSNQVGCILLYVKALNE